MTPGTQLSEFRERIYNQDGQFAVDPKDAPKLLRDLSPIISDFFLEDRMRRDEKADIFAELLVIQSQLVEVLLETQS